MFRIPFSFRNKNEDYLVQDKLQEFCNENGLKTNLDKIDLINSIETFANENPINQEKVLNWLDITLKEGVKKLLIQKVSGIRPYLNKSYEEWEVIIKEKFNINSNEHLLRVRHKNVMTLYGYKIDKVGDRVEKISFNYAILLKELKDKEQAYSTVIYPIFIDLYVEGKYIVARSKSKSSLNKIMLEDGNEVLVNITTDKLLKEAINITLSTLQLEEEPIINGFHIFKSKIHTLIDECTKTPPEIEKKLNDEETIREKFVLDFFVRQGINPILDENYKHAIDDLKIFMEKYLSITCEDKEIFTKDRYAYPIQIAATDEDCSSVEESSLEDIPLQCTPIFFDNKKVIQKQQKCDNVTVVFKKEPKRYFTNRSYRVIMIVKNGCLFVDFRKYALEEDIDCVLSRIIRDN